MSNTKPKLDLTDKIITFESSELDTMEVIELFGELIKSGQVWSLQGSYGRSAKEMIDSGFISPEGEVQHDYIDTILGEEV